jgi:predicted metal-dependent hydrolase
VRDTAQQLPLFSEDQPEAGRVPGFSVRRSSRAKRLSIKVFPRGRVEVVVPRRTSAGTVQAFVEENREWIGRARESFAEHYSPEAFVLPDVIQLPAIDLSVIVRYQPKAGADSVRVQFSNGLLRLSGNTGSEKHCVDALRRWLSGVAKREFAPRLEALAKLTQTPYSKMHVRMQRTCWGSRSSRGTISLNLCLLFLDPALLRYLMIHELCHGRHMNHSRRFWKLVSCYQPDYKRLDRRLGESWRDVPAWLGIY